MNVVCATDVCPIVLSSKCVFYEGDNLPFTGIVTNDNLQSALQKIELAFEGSAIGYVFQNGLTNIGSNTIELGGSILHNTTILGNYRLQFQGSLGASLFDSGGTSSQFVKGDGTLDSTTYQPSGNYITALTGDATATGPGSVPLTLATVNSNPGTFGDNSHIPVVTVNNKGLLTNVSTVAVSIPSGSLSFVGDVTGSGTTGSPVTLTLATVNTNIYNTDSFLKFSVNGKGLITSASPITALDIDGVLGYTPYNASNPAGYITLSSLSATSPITYSSGNFSTSMSTNRLIGRSSAGTGVMEEIQLGIGLTLSGGVLNSTGGTVTSVGLSMPSAFNVASSPITTSGTIAVTGAGLASQYIRGDGTLGDFPSVAGGASINYYLNGSVASGVVGYEQMSRTAVIGTGTNFSISTNGYIASFLTDVGDPNQLSIPGGNWIIRCYFQASSTGGSPSFYVELYKYNGTFTLLASSVANPEVITGGTAVDLYTTALAVPTTTLLATDRLAVRIWVNNSGRTITLHTEDTNLDEINTTFSTGISSLNGLTAPTQYFATSTTGTDFTISSATATHTFNLPIASGTNTGKLSNTDWTTFNNKVTSVSGTTNRITSTGGTTPVIDISASYAGQTSITTLGTVTTGTLSTGAIIGGVTMTLGSDASYDTYYRNSSGVLTRLPNGTTGQIYIATTGLAPSWSTLSSLAVTSISGTANQITASASTGAVTLSLPSLVAFPGTWTIGTLSYSDTGILWSAQSSTNSYNQSILQNTNAGATASTNFIVSNDLGTATTNYGELGINSSGFTGSGSFNIAGAVYLDASSGDLVLGTLANKPIHFVVNNGSTDALTIGTSGAITTGTWNGTAIVAQYGGTGLNTSASTGVAQVSAGTWSVSTALANGTTATTQSASDNSTKVATTAYTDNQATLGNWRLASGGTLTGANTITGTTSNTLKAVFNSLGTTQTDGAGLWLQNSTAAAVGAQQISPSIVWDGNGWKTNATAASQNVKFKADLLPIQGGTNPVAQLNFGASVNGSAYTNAFGIKDFNNEDVVTISNDQTQKLFVGIGRNLAISSNTPFIQAGTAVSSSNFWLGLTTGGLQFQRASTITMFGAGGNTGPRFLGIPAVSTVGEAAFKYSFGNENNGNDITLTSGDLALQTLWHYAGSSFGRFAPSSGNMAITSLRITPTIATSGTYAGVIRGIDYNPTETSMTGASHYFITNRSTTALSGFGTATPTATLQVNGSGSNPTLKTVGAGTTTNYSIRSFQSDGTTEILSLLDNGKFVVPLITSVVGFGTGSPNSTVHVSGSFAEGYVSKATSYTLTGTDCVIEVTATGQTMTLPTAVGCTGRVYTIKLTASGSCTVATTSSQTIDASTTYSLSAQYKYVVVQSNGTNWIIVGNN